MIVHLFLILSLLLHHSEAYWFLANRKSSLKTHRPVREGWAPAMVLNLGLEDASSNLRSSDEGVGLGAGANVDTEDSRSDTARSAGLGASIVSRVMSSPLYYPIVAQARRTMVKTAEASGVDWEAKYEYMKGKLGDEHAFEAIVDSVRKENPSLEYPSYYLQKFHGYKLGNLNRQSAIEQEIAGKAVGARNFPAAGKEGEEVLRGSYDREIISLCGESVLKGVDSLNSKEFVIADMGSGTGTSTRRMANFFQNSDRVIGIDMSPHMIAVARYLNKGTERGGWVEDITADKRVEFKYADIGATGLPNNSVDICSISLVLHELPESASLSVLQEAERILKPGGTLLIMEMDPSAPGYIKLRENSMLFAVLRSTEPWYVVRIC